MQLCSLVLLYFSTFFVWGYLNQRCEHFAFILKACSYFCSHDVNQKYYKIFYWFISSTLYWPWKYQSFYIVILKRCEKAHFEKLQDARLINAINKNNNKNNNKNKDMITKTFKGFVERSGTLLSVIWLKCFFFTYWWEIASFITFPGFSLLEQSINTLKLKGSEKTISSSPRNIFFPS